MPSANSRLAFILLSLTLLATPSLAQDTDAACTVTFDAIWSQATHPTDWPGSIAHFSPLIGASHNDQIVFWQGGDFATPGIREVAEFGSTGTFTNEIQTEIGVGTAEAVISGGGIGISPGSVTTSFDLTLDYPLVTLVTMIAPSPDWFVGVHGESLFENGSWVAEKIFQLPPYDAGTDSGTTFLSGNQITVPADPIALLTDPPLAGAPSMGTFTFRCTSNLLFTDDFESNDFAAWDSVVGAQQP